MSQISTLLGGAGVVTPLNIQLVPASVLVGTVDTDLPLTGLNWSIGGKLLGQIGSQALIQAYSKYKMNGMLGADVKVGQIIQIADGYIPNQQFQMNLTNAGATTPAIYDISRNFYKGNVFNVSPQVIVAGANQPFSNFIALQFDATNLSKADVTFLDPSNGKYFTNTMVGAELDSIFTEFNITDANGQLALMTTIDASRILSNGLFAKSCRLYAGAANLTVQVITIISI